MRIDKLSANEALQLGWAKVHLENYQAALAKLKSEILGDTTKEQIDRMFQASQEQLWHLEGLRQQLERGVPSHIQERCPQI